MPIIEHAGYYESKMSGVSHEHFCCEIMFLTEGGTDVTAKGLHQIRAGDLVRAVSAVTGGKGGGKPDSAMGGGSEVLKIDDALAIVDDFVAEKLGL